MDAIAHNGQAVVVLLEAAGSSALKDLRGAIQTKGEELLVGSHNIYGSKLCRVTRWIPAPTIATELIRQSGLLRRNVASRSLHSETVWGLESFKPGFLEEP